MFQLQEVAIRGGGIPGYFERLTNAYNSAKYRGLWRSTYAMSTVQEYFAEGISFNEAKHFTSSVWKLFLYWIRFLSTLIAKTKKMMLYLFNKKEHDS